MAGPDEIPSYGMDNGLYPPCETCGSEGNPSDLVLEESGQPPHFVCIECACTAFQFNGRFDLLKRMEVGRRDIVFLRHDPKSPSYRGGRASVQRGV